MKLVRTVLIYEDKHILLGVTITTIKIILPFKKKRQILEWCLLKWYTPGVPPRVFCLPCSSTPRARGPGLFKSSSLLMQSVFNCYH
jgi:hypothetical protein